MPASLPGLTSGSRYHRAALCGGSPTATGDRYHGLLPTDLPGKPSSPGLNRRPPRDAVENDACRLKEIGPQERITALGDLTAPVDLTRLVASRGQPKISSHAREFREPFWRIDDADKRHCCRFALHGGTGRFGRQFVHFL
jgi:hypothetical protein